MGLFLLAGFGFAVGNVAARLGGMAERTIQEHTLKGIGVALQRHAPHLVPVIIRLLQTGFLEPSDGGIGQSFHGTLTGSMPLPDGEAVLKALEEIEAKHGDALFEGRQINSLVSAWRIFSEPRRISP